MLFLIDQVNFLISISFGISVIIMCTSLLLSIGSFLPSIRQQGKLSQPTASRLVYEAPCSFFGFLGLVFMGMSFALGALCVAIASLKSLVSGSTNSLNGFNDPIINFILFTITGAFGLIFVFFSCAMLLELDMGKVFIFDADNRLIIIRRKTIFGKRTQDIPFDKIIDIESTPSLDDDGKIWSYELALVVGDKETIGLDTCSAGDEKIVKLQQENAKRIRLFLGN